MQCHTWGWAANEKCRHAVPHGNEQVLCNKAVPHMGMSSLATQGNAVALRDEGRQQQCHPGSAPARLQLFERHENSFFPVFLQISKRKGLRTGRK
eukprot:665344-Pelagomonas_calceolata.AAC.1